MAFRESNKRTPIIPTSIFGKPKFAGGNYFVYLGTKLGDILGKKVKGVFTYPYSFIEFEDGTKIAFFGKDIEVHIWKEDKNE